MPVLILLKETNPQFQIPPSTENICCTGNVASCLEKPLPRPFFAVLLRRGAGMVAEIAGQGTLVGEREVVGKLFQTAP